MLTKGDEYPIHQLPEPVATAGSDRNFYDRFFFNGYLKDGGLFFACALGVYPHLNIMDGAFSIVKDGRQRNLRVTKVMHSERIDTQVGPLKISVIEPLESLRIQVDSPDHGIKADLIFTGRHFPVEEPRFTRRQGPRMVLDVTRMTQNGSYEGYVKIDGERTDFYTSNNWGTRDRSWGVRPIGMPDPQPNAPVQPPQFYWLWAPLNFKDLATYFHVNSDENGHAWNTKGLLVPTGGGAEMLQREVSSTVHFQPGTRSARRAEIHLTGFDNVQTTITLTPHWHFSMSGIGYTHPEWGHGHFRGEYDIGYDEYVLDRVNPLDPMHLHIQAFCTVKLESSAGSSAEGLGVLEQLIIGPHGPSGFTDLLDPAPEDHALDTTAHGASGPYGSGSNEPGGGA